MRVKIECDSAAQKTQSVLYYSGLSEKNQRHFLALEYNRFGVGSQRYLSEVYRCSRTRIRRGVAELCKMTAQNQPADYTSQRRPGGGAKKKKWVSPT